MSDTNGSPQYEGVCAALTFIRNAINSKEHNIWSHPPFFVHRKNGESYYSENIYFQSILHKAIDVYEEHKRQVSERFGKEHNKLHNTK